MIWKKYLSSWLVPDTKKILALVRKEWLIYADQKFYLFISLAFQLVLLGVLFSLGNFIGGGIFQAVPGFSLSYLQYSYVVLLVIMIFSSISGHLPGRLLQELEGRNLVAYLLTPSSFFLWVVAAGMFGIFINSLYFLLLTGLGIILFKLNFFSSLVLVQALAVVLLAVFGLGLLLCFLVLVFRRGYLFYNFLETGLILLIACLLPAGHFSGALKIIKITPHYLIFKLLGVVLSGEPAVLKLQIFLMLEVVIFWLLGLFLLKAGFNWIRQKGSF